MTLTGWGRTAPSRATVYRPRNVSDVQRMLEQGGAATIARGLGRSYGDAAQAAAGNVLDMTGMASIGPVDRETATVSVDAGVSLDSLLRRVVPLGWFVPVSPGTRFVTVGGAIAADIHGKNHHCEGAFGDHVVDLELLSPDGEHRRVTPSGDPEVFWATVGGMGLTGVVLKATLRLLPIETSLMRVDTERASDLDDVMARMESGDRHYRYSVAWIDCLAGEGRLARLGSLGRAVLTRGDHATLQDLEEGGGGLGRRGGLGGGGGRGLGAEALTFAPKIRLTAPRWVPAVALSRPTAVAFNELWFRKAPRSQRDRLQSLTSFFHPLDAVAEWNRLWGASGFLQYQFVVPFGAEGVVREVLERLRAARVPSLLAVLKRFGPERGLSLMSFPLAGWTLALDMRADLPGLGPVLDGLDELVASVGGRVYLAKDARLRPDVLEAMYPGLPRWREIRAGLDPTGLMRSDLARRLGLT